MEDSDRPARFEIGARVRVIAAVRHEGRIAVIRQKYQFSDDERGLYTHRYVVRFVDDGSEGVFFTSELVRSN